MVVYLKISGNASEQATPENATIIPATTGTNLARCLWLGGVFTGRVLCANLGRCGNCRVRYLDQAPTFSEKEKSILGEEALAAGWRLACQHIVDPAAGLLLELPSEKTDKKNLDALGSRYDIAIKKAALAVDLGTTSISWKSLALDASEKKDPSICSGSFVNPQAGCGADIVSRLEMATRSDGALHLSSLIIEDIKKIITSHFSGGWSIERICVAANTAMTDIFLQQEICGLTRAPFRLAHHGNSFFKLSGLPPIYIPPFGAPFIGGDISAGTLALIEAGVRRPFILADMGTNGEFVLLDNNDRLFMTSVPLGPALEGAGMDCGQLAGSGIFSSFSISPNGIRGKMAENFSPDVPSAGNYGISATGYISLLALLHRIGVLDDEGHFVHSKMPIAKMLERDIVTDANGARLTITENLWLSTADIEEMLKIKSAFSLALQSLLTAAGIEIADIESICLGGALGQYASAMDLVELGFIPAMLEKRLSCRGNTSLAGAASLVLNPKKGDKLARLFKNATLVCVQQRNDFMETYLEHMKFCKW